MYPQQGHQSTGAVNAQGQKVGGQFTTVNHGENQDVFFGQRETLNLRAAPQAARPQASPRPSARKAPLQNRPLASISNALRYTGAAAMAAGGFASTTAGTAMAASSSIPMGIAVLVIGAAFTAAAVKTADSTMSAPSIVR